MRLLSVLILATVAVNTQAAEPWFVDLPDFKVEQSPVELPLVSFEQETPEEVINWHEPDWPRWGCIEETLSEADRLLADPRTIHFHVGKTYEVYIPIMGKEPVKKIRTMQVIQPNIPDDWARRVY